VRDAIDKVGAVVGKTVSFVDVALLLDVAGVNVVDAAGGAGTALTTTRTKIDFGDAGIDSVRVVVRGKNSAAGSITVQVYDVTNGAVLASVVVTGVADQTATGAWTRLVPVGEDAEIEMRVVGNAADDPTLYAVHFQGRTTQART
jgi:hypothetical protein